MSNLDSSVPHGCCHCGCGQKTKLAKQTDRKLGWVKGEPIYYIKGHQNRRPAEDRFWDKVRRTPKCWLWQGSKGKHGHGQFVAGRVLTNAHRFSYELHYAPIPKGMAVCHRCDNPSCVAPYHLFLGTALDNQYDSIRKGRHSSAKLSEPQVKEIFWRAKRGEKRKMIAQEYDVSEATVSRIAAGKIWKSVLAA